MEVKLSRYDVVRGANIVDDVKEGAKTAKEHVTDFGAKTANEIEYIVSKEREIQEIYLEQKHWITEM